MAIAAQERLYGLLRAAAFGQPPPADGEIECLPGLPGPVDAILAFTAHHVLAANVDPAAVRAVLPPEDLAAPMSPRFLLWLAEQLGAAPGALDLVLAAPAAPGPPPLPLSTATVEHPRVTRAQRLRHNVTVYTDPTGDGLLAVGQGLAGRWELAFEVALPRRGRGLGRALAAAARCLVPSDEPIFAQVAAGNAMSLRAILAAGYRPIGSEVLYYRPH